MADFLYTFQLQVDETLIPSPKHRVGRLALVLRIGVVLVLGGRR